jgi:hypothetical protein
MYYCVIIGDDDGLLVLFQQPAQGVDDAVDAFFGAGDTGVKGVLDGFKNVVKVGLSAILGDSSAGESYDEKFFVCIKQYAPAR